MTLDDWQRINFEQRERERLMAKGDATMSETTDEKMQALVKECGLDWQRGYVPLFDGDPTNRYAVLIEAAVEQATAELRSELSAALARADEAVVEAKQWKNSALAMEAERDAALATVARYETLRPEREWEADGDAAQWWLQQLSGEWSPVDPVTGTHWTPLPDVKEPAK